MTIVTVRGVLWLKEYNLRLVMAVSSNRFEFDLHVDFCQVLFRGHISRIDDVHDRFCNNTRFNLVSSHWNHRSLNHNSLNTSCESLVFYVKDFVYFILLLVFIRFLDYVMETNFYSLFTTTILTFFILTWVKLEAVVNILSVPVLLSWFAKQIVLRPV